MIRADIVSYRYRPILQYRYRIGGGKFYRDRIYIPILCSPHINNDVFLTLTNNADHMISCVSATVTQSWFVTYEIYFWYKNIYPLPSICDLQKTYKESRDEIICSRKHQKTNKQTNKPKIKNRIQTKTQAMFEVSANNRQATWCDDVSIRSEEVMRVKLRRVTSKTSGKGLLNNRRTFPLERVVI